MTDDNKVLITESLLRKFFEPHVGLTIPTTDPIYFHNRPVPGTVNWWGRELPRRPYTIPLPFMVRCARLDETSHLHTLSMRMALRVLEMRTPTPPDVPLPPTFEQSRDFHVQRKIRGDILLDMLARLAARTVQYSASLIAKRAAIDAVRDKHENNADWVDTVVRTAGASEGVTLMKHLNTDAFRTAMEILEVPIPEIVVDSDLLSLTPQDTAKWCS